MDYDNDDGDNDNDATTGKVWSGLIVLRTGKGYKLL